MQIIQSGKEIKSYISLPFDDSEAAVAEGSMHRLHAHPLPV
jgi:hypothetical protein